MSDDDYYTHVPLNVVGSLRAITPERLAQLLKAEADLAAARALLREVLDCDQQAIPDWLANDINAALAGDKP